MHQLRTSSSHNVSVIRKTFLIAVLMLSGLLLNAQTPALSLGTVGICNNTSVSVPLIGNNLSNIGAITLFIKYDSLSLSFSSVENIDPQLSSGLIFNALNNPPRIAIVWSKTSGATFMNTTLLKLRFDVIKKSGNLQFINDNCEIANAALPPEIISVSYTNGSVFGALPTIISEPENKTVFPQANAAFQVSSPNALEYVWQESRNSGIYWTNLSESSIYNGTQTNTLVVNQVPLNYNQFRYRCMLNPTSCVVVSAAAILSVDSLAGLAGQPSKSFLHLTISPNPFSEKTIIEYSVPEYGYVTIKIFSMTGQTMEIPVSNLQIAGHYKVEDSFIQLPAGIYFCQYVFNGQTSVYETNRKIIKFN